ncbi:MAG: CoA-transferase, partial [Burkholderiales bacterium]|nr:CoA-transferase [Burkholderiales bacterium]
GDPAKPKTRLPGTGGGNDIASLAQMIVAMKHEKRRFVSNVDFVTSPGFLRGGTTRHDSGLAAGGMYRVVTDLGIFGFDDTTRRMNIVALHPGVTVEQVQDNTGFELACKPEIGVTERPTELELEFLRKLDPERLYTA